MKVIPKKSLGQNFLIDKDVIKLISNCADIENQDVLEVGPGTGNLTVEILAKKPKKLFVIEKDDNLLLILKKKLNDSIIYINDDILNISEEKISKNKLIVFGNLPYNISTEILIKWILNLKSNFWFSKLVLMFQKEVADRIISKSNQSDYGRLSILSNWKLNVKKIFDIKPYSFYPKPKVESSLLVFSPKEDYLQLKNSKTLEKITRIFFNQRRKKIKKPYNQLFENNVEYAKKLNINLDLRPQNLDHETYYLLAKEFENLRD